MDDQTREDTVQAEVMETPLSSENDARAVVWNNFSRGMQSYCSSVVPLIILCCAIYAFCLSCIFSQKQSSDPFSLFFSGAKLFSPLIIWYLVFNVKSMRSFWGMQSVWIPNAHTMIAVSWGLLIGVLPVLLFAGLFLKQGNVSIVIVTILYTILSMGSMICFFHLLRQFGREFAPELYALYNRLIAMYYVAGISIIAIVAFSADWPALIPYYFFIAVIPGIYFMYALEKSGYYFNTTTPREFQNAVTQDNTSGPVEGAEPWDINQNPCPTKRKFTGCGVLILLVFIYMGVSILVRKDQDIYDVNPKENDNITAPPSNSIDRAAQDNVNYYNRVVSEFVIKEAEIEKEWEMKITLAQLYQISDAQLLEWIEEQYRPVFAEMLDKIDPLELDYLLSYKYIKEILTERLEGVDLIIAGLKNQSMEQVKHGSMVVARTQVKAVLYNLNTGQNVPDYNKNTALLFAASIGDLETVKELEKFGADVNYIDIQGKSALDYAQQAEENEELLKYLEDASNAQIVLPLLP